MRTVLKFFATLALLVTPVRSFAIEPLVSTDWLAENLGMKNMIVLDIRKVEEYKAGHIPDAVNMFQGGFIVKNNGLRNELPQDDDLAELLADAGISDDSYVVVAGNVTSVVEAAYQARTAWTLVYAGVKDVALLDGGFTKWSAEKRTISSKPERRPASDFKPSWKRSVFINKQGIVENASKSVLADIRPAEQYSGENPPAIAMRPGHISGAVNIPPDLLLNEDLTYKSRKELTAVIAKAVGVDKSRPVIVYCNTGIFASNGWFVLNRLLGYENVRLYDGSIEEYSADESLPMRK